jgi:hypothetical protein
VPSLKTVLSSIVIAFGGSLHTTIAAAFNSTAADLITREPADCQLANKHYAQKECFYDWDTDGEPVTGAGQETPGWCQGIRDNIIRKCGKDMTTTNYSLSYSPSKACFNDDPG